MECKGRCWNEISNGAGFLSLVLKYEVMQSNRLEYPFVGGLWRKHESSLYWAHTPENTSCP